MMNDLDLTIERVNLICAVINGQNASRKTVITRIYEILPEIRNAKFILTAIATMNMLENMSDDEFDECHFSEIAEA